MSFISYNLDNIIIKTINQDMMNRVLDSLRKEKIKPRSNAITSNRP